MVDTMLPVELLDVALSAALSALLYHIFLYLKCAALDSSLVLPELFLRFVEER